MKTADRLPSATDASAAPRRPVTGPFAVLFRLYYFGDQIRRDSFKT